MKTLERYILRQILGPLGFFMLVLTGIIWLSQSLRIIDIVVNNGQGAQVLLELAALQLPFAMSIVLPFSATLATVYALNRLTAESELIAALAGGASRGRLARPVLALGLIITLLLSFVTLYLMPTSAQQFRDRVAEVRADLAGGLIREGRFLFPTPNVTMFVGEVTSDGQMRDLLIHDARAEAASPDAIATTYLARRALLAPRVGSGEDAVGPFLQMADVQLQTLTELDSGGQALQRASFETFTIDLSQFIETAGERVRKPSEYYFYDLISPPEDRIRNERDRGRFLSEGHEQLSAPLYGLAMPLVAAAAMFSAAFSRRGMGRAVALGLGLAMIVRVAGFAAKNATASAPDLWPLMHLAPLASIAIAAYFLTRTGFKPPAPAGPTRLGPAAPRPPEPRDDPRSDDSQERGVRSRSDHGRAGAPTTPRRPQRRGP